MEKTDRNLDTGKDMNASKLRGDCRTLAAESYKCLETHTRTECKPFFENYKSCRKEEHSRVMAENAKKYAAANGD